MTTTRKLAVIVGRRLDLTADEVAELDGRTLSELAAHGEHLIARRRYVADHLKAHPTANESDLVRDFDGRRRPEAAAAGRRFVSAAVGDHVNRDPRTTSFLNRVGRAALTSSAPVEDDVRRQRVRDRLEAAGFAEQRDYGPTSHHDRSF